MDFRQKHGSQPYPSCLPAASCPPLSVAPNSFVFRFALSESREALEPV